MVKKVLNYVTDDGKHFDSEEDAHLHEISVSIIKSTPIAVGELAYTVADIDKLRMFLSNGIRNGLLKYTTIAQPKSKETFMTN
jgi:hypothetical protein